jgi:hypothetical protein
MPHRGACESIVIFFEAATKVKRRSKHRNIRQIGLIDLPMPQKTHNESFGPRYASGRQPGGPSPPPAIGGLARITPPTWPLCPPSLTIPLTIFGEDLQERGIQRDLPPFAGFGLAQAHGQIFLCEVNLSPCQCLDFCVTHSSVERQR